MSKIDPFYGKTTLQLERGRRIRTEKQRSKSTIKSQHRSPIYEKRNEFFDFKYEFPEEGLGKGAIKLCIQTRSRNLTKHYVEPLHGSFFIFIL